MMTAVEITRLVTIVLFVVAGTIISVSSHADAAGYLFAAAVGAATNAAVVPIVKGTVDKVNGTNGT